MDQLNLAKVTEEMAMAALFELAKNASDNHMLSNTIVGCLQARINGEEHPLIPRYIWEASKNDVVWEFRGAGASVDCEYRFLANPLVRGIVPSLSSSASDEEILATIKAHMIIEQAKRASLLIRKMA